MANINLDGRVALVTGAARGIGAAIAAALAQAGAAVMIGDVLADVGGDKAAEIAASGARTRFARLDVTHDGAWADAVATTVAEFGGLDILVNNAGVEVTELIADIDADQLRRMLDVNVLGTALGMKHAFRAMRPDGAAGRGGAILNIASVAATIAFPGIAGYSATKSAIDRLTRIGAAESGRLGYGIRVNCLYPGLVPTDMGLKLAQDVVAVGLYASVEAAIGDVVGQTPSRRLGTVEDMADAALFLCSDAARFVNGVGLPVDGGMGT